MATTEVKTFLDIKNAVIRRGKFSSTDQNTIDDISEFINTRQREICTGASKKYSFLYANRDIIINKTYTTGTVSISNGGRIVTGTGTVWTQYFVKRKIIFSGQNEIYTIVSVDDSAQELTLSSQFVGSTITGGSYTIYKDEYGLFPDLRDIDFIHHDNFAGGLLPISADEMDELFAYRKLNQGFARYYTLYGYKKYDPPPLDSFVLDYDFLGSSTNTSMKIFPALYTSDYILHIRYVKNIPLLENDIDEPIIPLHYRDILVYGALADMYAKHDDSMYKFFNAKYEQLLKKLDVDTLDTSNKLSFVSSSADWSENISNDSGGSVYRKSEVDL